MHSVQAAIIKRPLQVSLGLAINFVGAFALLQQI